MDSEGVACTRAADLCCTTSPQTNPPVFQADSRFVLGLDFDAVREGR